MINQRVDNSKFSVSEKWIANNIYRTFFMANHRKLYFISVFIYTCIKVKLTEGEKEAASPKPNRPTDFLFWLQKNHRNRTKKQSNIRPCQSIKTDPKIREFISNFAAPIGEIITDMPYLCEAKVSGRKRAIFSIFPLFWDRQRRKVLNLRFLTKKQVNFRAVYLLICKLLIINWHNMLHRQIGCLNHWWVS